MKPFFSKYRRGIKDLDTWVLCNQIEDDLEEVLAKYNGLVKKETFSDIAVDVWEKVCDEDGDAYGLYPSMGDEVKF